MLSAYLKGYLYTLATLLFLLLISTVLSYFDLINFNVLNILRSLFITISILVGSFFVGKSSSSKGFKEGLKFALIFIFFILLMNLIFFRNFSLNTLFQYFLILISGMTGASGGINRKTLEK